MRCVVERKFVVILWLALCSLQSTYAQTQEHVEGDTEGYDRFDGSEFNAPSFMDTSFEKPDYKELRRMPTPVGSLSKEGGGPLSKEGGFLRKRQNDKGITAAGSANENGPLATTTNNLAAAEKLPPIIDLPSDWVPDSLSLTSNGGFSIAPFNGAPVPYELNGHVDIQRGRP